MNRHPLRAHFIGVKQGLSDPPANVRPNTCGGEQTSNWIFSSRCAAVQEEVLEGSARLSVARLFNEHGRNLPRVFPCT